MHPVVAEVTARIAERSAATRSAYLERIRAAAAEGPARGDLGCANLAHGFAACGADEKLHLRAGERPQRRDRLGLQRHALGAPAVRALPRDPQEGRAAGRRRRPVRRRRARHVRRHHAGPRRHGAVAVQPRRGRHGDRGRALARHVRRRADARRVRQDRPRAADRRAVLRPPADRLRPRRADAVAACRTARRAASASSTPRARSAATSCSRPRRSPTTRPAPAPSTAPPTPTSSSSRRWACTCRARASSTRARRCAAR